MMLFDFALRKWLKLNRCSSHKSFRLNVRVEGGGGAAVPSWNTWSHRRTRAILVALARIDTDGCTTCMTMYMARQILPSGVVWTAHSTCLLGVDERSTTSRTSSCFYPKVYHHHVMSRNITIASDRRHMQKLSKRSQEVSLMHYVYQFEPIRLSIERVVTFSRLMLLPLDMTDFRTNGSLPFPLHFIVDIPHEDMIDEFNGLRSAQRSVDRR